MKTEDVLKSTSDIWFCSFLIIKGHKISKYDVINRGKVKCYFAIDDDKWRELKLEFNNSEVVHYKATIERLKDLAF